MLIAEFSLSRITEYRIRMFAVCLIALFLIALSSVAHGQTAQASLTGTVTDATGAFVPGATVLVTQAETGTTVKTISNDRGLYSVESLNPGQYAVQVSKSGFSDALVKQITVQAAQAVTINVSLKVGSSLETVTVSADSSLINTETTDVAVTVDHAIVQELPFPERSSLGAVLLSPGVTGDPSTPGGVNSENAPITTGPVTPGASLSVGGGPPGSSTILVDGSDITQSSYPRTGINLSGDVVQETTVLTSGLSAQYGRTSGGAIVQASRSGTAEYHGMVSWRHTDPYFNAFPLGSSAANAQHENFYGFYLGGPVPIPRHGASRKTFFFVGVEPARIQNALSYRGAFNQPDELQGHLHNALTLLDQTVLKNQGYAAAVAAARIGGIYSSTTRDANGFPNGAQGAAPAQQYCGASCAAAPDDVSAQLAKNPFAQFVIANLPTPSNPGPYVQFDNSQGTYANDATNAVYRRGVKNIDNRWSARIDHQFNNNNQLFVRYTDIPLNGPRYFALADSNPLNQVPTDVTASQNLAVGFTHIFRSNLVGVGRYDFLRVNEARTPPSGALQKDYAGSFGLTPATAGRGFPTLGTLGTSVLQVAATSPYTDIDENFTGGVDFTWVNGNHNVQFGTEVRWIESNQYDFSNLYGGRYAFAQQLSNSTGTSAGKGGSALASLILGQISSFTTAPVEVPGYYRWRYNAAYVQDNWKVTPSLTLNMGMRWEVETPRREKFNNQAIVQLNQNVGFGSGAGASSSNAAFCFSGACGLGSTLWPTNWKGFEPRIGFSLAATRNMSVRGSYGMMRMPLTGWENLPDPNLNVASQAVTSTSGAQDPTRMTNYITNPVGPISSSYTVLNGARGPFSTAQGFSPVYVDQTTAVPYSQTYGLTIQYEPTPGTLFQATYQAMKGTHLIGAFTGSMNVPSMPTILNAIQKGTNLSRTFANPYGITQNGAVVQETALQALNPYQNFFNQTLTEIYPRRGTSSYNGLLLSARERVSQSLTVLASYTWQKSLDNVPDVSSGNQGNFGNAAPQDPTNPFSEWSVSAYDQPSTLRMGYDWNLPLGRGSKFDAHNGVLNALIGQLSTSGIMTAASGFPNFVTLGSTGYFTSFTPKGQDSCTTANYCASTALPAGYVLRPDIVPGVPLINPHWKDNPFGTSFTPYLNPAAFAVPGSIGAPRLGNAPRTLAGARTPREFLFDARVKKGIRFGDRYVVNITGTFNNVFNHPAYFGANNTANDPLQTAVTNVTNQGQPSITFNPSSTTFGKLNVAQISGFSRVIRVGAEFVF